MKNFLDEFIDYTSVNDMENALDYIDNILEKSADTIIAEIKAHKAELEQKLWERQGRCPLCGCEYKEEDCSFSTFVGNQKVHHNEIELICPNCG